MSAGINNAEVRELVRIAEQLGFKQDGFDGRGHLQLRHPNGARYPVPSSPSDRRWMPNARSDLERLSGQRSRRQKSGTYRHTRVAPMALKKSATEEAMSREVDALLTEAARLADRWAELLSDGADRRSATNARGVLSRHREVRAQLAQYHRIIPPLSPGDEE